MKVEAHLFREDYKCRIMIRFALTAILTITAALNTSLAQEGSPGQVVKTIYEMVSTERNQDPDWDSIRTYFIPESIVVMRVSKDSSAVFSLEEWIQDFKGFIVNSDVHSTGFIESVQSTNEWECGNVAQVNVVYTSERPGVRAPREGIDAFQLAYINGAWKIVSIINEIPSEERTVPENFLCK